MNKRKPLLSTDKIELIPTEKRVRVRFNNEFIADSRSVVILREEGKPPVYYFPKDNVRRDLLEKTEHQTHCPHKGDASYWTVNVGGKHAENAAWAYLAPVEEAQALAGYLAFYWKKMDAWLEEDEEVDVHPHDPYHRIDALKSSRHVKVVLDGKAIAETRRPTLLFETDLPVRYYLPKLDVHLDLLEPSSHKTRCPYKGEASYYHLRSGDTLLKDIAWSYPYPKLEALPVAGQLCFFQEKLDLVVDGQKLEKP